MGNMCGCGKKEASQTISAEQTSLDGDINEKSATNQTSSPSLSESSGESQNFIEATEDSSPEAHISRETDPALTPREFSPETEEYSALIRQALKREKTTDETIDDNNETVKRVISLSQQTTTESVNYLQTNDNGVNNCDSSFDSDLLKRTTSAPQQHYSSYGMQSTEKRISETDRMLPRRSDTSYGCVSDIQSHPTLFCLKEHVMSKNSSPKDSIRSSVDSFSSSSSSSQSSPNITEADPELPYEIDGMKIVAEMRIKVVKTKSKPQLEQSSGEDTGEQPISECDDQTCVNYRSPTDEDIDGLLEDMTNLQLNSRQNDNITDAITNCEEEYADYNERNRNESEPQSTVASYKYQSSSVLAPIPEETVDEEEKNVFTNRLSIDKIKNNNEVEEAVMTEISDKCESATVSPKSMTSMHFAYPSPSPDEQCTGGDAVAADNGFARQSGRRYTGSPLVETIIGDEFNTTSDSSATSSSSPHSYRVFK